MVLDSYQEPATVEMAIKEMADHYRIGYKFHQPTALIYRQVVNDINIIAGKEYTWRYPYSVERKTIYPSPFFVGAVLRTHQKLFDSQDDTPPKDKRPGAMRLAYPDNVDAHAERKLIIENLEPLERYYALRQAVAIKRKKPK